MSDTTQMDDIQTNLDNITAPPGTEAALGTDASQEGSVPTIPDIWTDRERITVLGLVEGYQTVGRTYRVIVNVGTKSTPLYKSFTRRELEDDPTEETQNRLKFRQHKSKLEYHPDTLRYIMAPCLRIGHRRVFVRDRRTGMSTTDVTTVPAATFFKYEDGWATKTEFKTKVKGLNGDRAIKRMIAHADHIEELLYESRLYNFDPDTYKPLSEEDRTMRPWLFNDPKAPPALNLPADPDPINAQLLALRSAILRVKREESLEDNVNTRSMLASRHQPPRQGNADSDRARRQGQAFVAHSNEQRVDRNGVGDRSSIARTDDDMGRYQQTESSAAGRPVPTTEPMAASGSAVIGSIGTASGGAAPTEPGAMDTSEPAVTDLTGFAGGGSAPASTTTNQEDGGPQNADGGTNTQSTTLEDQMAEDVGESGSQQCQSWLERGHGPQCQRMTRTPPYCHLHRNNHFTEIPEEEM